MLDDTTFARAIPRMSTYPLRGYAFPVVLLFAVLFWVLLHLGSIKNPIIWPGLLILSSWLSRYIFLALEHTLNGYEEAPACGAEVLNPVNGRSIKFLTYAAAWATLGMLLQPLTEYAVFICAGLGVFFLPAAVLSLVVTDRFSSTLNPVHWLRIAATLKQDYTLMLFLILLSLPVLLLLFVLRQYLFFWLFFIYALLFSAHVMGVALYYHRAELGLPVSRSSEREEEAALYQDQLALQKILDRLHSVNASRQTERINAVFKETLETLGGDTLDVHETLFPSISLWTYKYLPRIQTQHYISLLLQNQQAYKALEVYRLCNKPGKPEYIPKLFPRFPGQYLILAKQAAGEQDYSTALHLLENLGEAQPNKSTQEEAHSLRAELLAKRHSASD